MEAVHDKAVKAIAARSTGAAKVAKQHQKLAFYLHVSGHFEDSGFT